MKVRTADVTGKGFALFACGVSVRLLLWKGRRLLLLLYGGASFIGFGLVLLTCPGKSRAATVVTVLPTTAPRPDTFRPACFFFLSLKPFTASHRCGWPRRKKGSPSAPCCREVLRSCKSSWKSCPLCPRSKRRSGVSKDDTLCVRCGRRSFSSVSLLSLRVVGPLWGWCWCWCCCAHRNTGKVVVPKPLLVISARPHGEMGTISAHKRWARFDICVYIVVLCL